MFNSSHNPHIHNSSISQNNTTINHGQFGVTRGFDILTKAVAPNAFHNSDDSPDPPKCHENTRVAVINKIMGWVKGEIDSDAFFLWLYGPAGAGKSAIGRTVAELCEELGLLLASFFFFRTDSRRNSLDSFVASIAYFIPLVVPSSRGLIEGVVDANPLIFQSSIEVQFTKLVLEPLQNLSDQGHFETTPLPPLIIIDGLDECLDEDSQAKLVRVLASSMQKWRLPLKFLVASRPEQRIKFGFQSLEPQSLISHLELNNDFSSDEDIRLFLSDKFDHIRRNHPLSARILMSPWPSKAQLDDLVRKASGQFVYASMAIRFVDSPRHIPTHRLDIILDLRPADRDLPFAQLDKLYQCILSRVLDPPLVSQILGVSLAIGDDLAAMRLIERVLSLEEGEASTALVDLHSLIRFEDDRIIFHHSSFPDFLRSQQRSKDHYVDVPHSHATILRYVLQAFRRHGDDTESCSTNNTVSRQGQSVTDLPEEVYAIDMQRHLRGSLSMLDLEDDIKGFDVNVYMQQGRGHRSVWRLAFNVKRLLKQMEFTDLHDLREHHSTVLDQFIHSDLQTYYPEKRLLLSMVWFILQKPSRSIARHRTPQGVLLWCTLWSEVLEFDPTDWIWQERYEILTFPTEYNKWRTEFRGVASLEVLYGDAKATARYVPPRLLGDRLARLAAICTEHLRHWGSGKRRATKKILHAWAVKSASSPWLSKRRTRQISYQGKLILIDTWHEKKRRASRQLSQSIRGVARLFFGLPQDARTLRANVYIRYRWMLDFLRRLFFVARDSSDLQDLLSKPLLPYPAHIIFPRRIRRLNQAVERYLNRFLSMSSRCDRPEDSDGSMVEESLFNEPGYASCGLGDDGYVTCPEYE